MGLGLTRYPVAAILARARLEIASAWTHGLGAELWGFIPWMFHTPYPHTHTLPGRVSGMQKGGQQYIYYIIMYPGMV